MFIFLAFLALSSSQEISRLSKDMEEILLESRNNDYGNRYTCKRPSLKSLLYIMEDSSRKCKVKDENSLIYQAYQNVIINQCSEIQSMFITVWQDISDNGLEFDSWLPVSGVGINNKGGKKHLVSSNIDSIYLLGNHTQYSESLIKISITSFPDRQIDVYEFITERIGSLLGTFFINNEKVLLNQAILEGEKLIILYEQNYPFTTYNFKERVGEYGKIPLRNILNAGEIYALYSQTQDENLKDILENIEKQAQELLKLEYLPECAYVQKSGKLAYEGSIYAKGGSGEIQRILYNNWVLSEKKATVYKELLEKNKLYVLKSTLFASKEGQPILAERDGDEIQYRMNLKTCSWVGILAQENLLNANTTEVKFAQKLFSTCTLYFARDSLPHDYLILETSGISQSDKISTIYSEIFEGAYFLFKATRDFEYRKFVSQAFQVIHEVSKVKYGYTVPGKDLTPNDFFTKTVKYFFLTYNEDYRFKTALFSPAGHMLGNA